MNQEKNGQEWGRYGRYKLLLKIRQIFKVEDNLEDINFNERMILKWSL